MSSNEMLVSTAIGAISAYDLLFFCPSGPVGPPSAALHGGGARPPTSMAPSWPGAPAGPLIPGPAPGSPCRSHHAWFWSGIRSSSLKRSTRRRAALRRPPSSPPDLPTSRRLWDRRGGLLKLAPGVYRWISDRWRMDRRWWRLTSSWSAWRSASSSAACRCRRVRRFSLPAGRGCSPPPYGLK